MVRAYTAGGNVLWQHITPSGPFSGQFLSALALSPDVAYVSGAVTGFGGGEILMQAFDLTNGSLLFEDRSHGGRFSSGGAISVGKSLVFAGGTASDGDSIDLLVRAYDRAAIETQGEPSSVLEPNVTLDPLR
jgi:hypothetical protein